MSETSDENPGSRSRSRSGTSAQPEAPTAVMAALKSAATMARVREWTAALSSSPTTRASRIVTISCRRMAGAATARVTTPKPPA
jgi:hypothetical protein